MSRCGKVRRVLRLISLLFLFASFSANAAPMGLPDLIERARANDYRVKQAQSELRFYRSKYDEAKWAWFPRIDSYFLVAGPTPEARNNGLGGPPTTQATLLYDTNFGQPGVMMRAGAEGMLPVYTFGKLDALEEAGRNGVKAYEALAQSAKDEAQYQVTQAYYGYCLAKAASTVMSDMDKRLNDAEATLKRLREEGSAQVTQMDVYKLGYYRQQAETQRAAAENGVMFAMAAIRLLVAAKDGEVIEVQTDELVAPEGELAPSDSYVIEAADYRPELRAVAAGLLAREQEVKIREAMYFPDFGIIGFFRWAWTTNATRQKSPFAYDPYNELTAGVGLGMRYTWDFPQKSIQLEQARAEYEKMEHQKELAGAGVKLEIEKAWGEARMALTKAQKQNDAASNARRWANAASTAFDLGTGDTRDLMDSFMAYAQSSYARMQAAHDARVAMAALTRAVGKEVKLEPVSAPTNAPAKLKQ